MVDQRSVKIQVVLVKSYLVYLLTMAAARLSLSDDRRWLTSFINRLSLKSDLPTFLCLRLIQPTNTRSKVRGAIYPALP